MFEIRIWKCNDCGKCMEEPFSWCSRCQREAFLRQIERCFEKSTELRAVYADPWGTLLLSDGNYGFFRVRDARITLEMGEAKSREDLVKDAMHLRDENRELLAENAKLRRELEKR